jgi:type VI secretion system protein ImpA
MIDTAELLNTIGGESATGRDLRYTSTWIELTESRRFEDERLPRGHWDRPVIKADFRKLEALCSDILAHESKDFQVTLWLLEAWTMRYGAEGLSSGLKLVCEMVDEFWKDGFPSWTPEEPDAREGVFAWFASEIPEILKRSVWIFPEHLTETPLSYAQFIMAKDYRRRGDMSTVELSGDELDLVNTFEDVSASVYRKPEFVVYIDDQIDQFLIVVERLKILNDKLADLISPDGPSMGRVMSEIDQLLHSIAGLKREANPKLIQFSLEDLLKRKDRATTSQGETEEDSGIEEVEDVEGHKPVRDESSELTKTFDLNEIHTMDRATTYATISAIADHLQRLEPHSPTPYLLKRAVRWGNMSLTDVLEEIRGDGSDIERVLNLLTGPQSYQDD